MEALISQIEWMPVLVSFLISFALGWVWYSPKMFYKKWYTGRAVEFVAHPMWMPMSAQLGSTLLLAIVVNLATTDGHIAHAVLVAITIAGFIKANGLFGGKSKAVVSIETGFVLVMTAIMIAVNMVM